MCRLRLVVDGGILPATPETPTRQAGKSDSVGSTGKPLIATISTQPSTGEPGPILMAKPWSLTNGLRSNVPASTADLERSSTGRQAVMLGCAQA